MSDLTPAEAQKQLATILKLPGNSICADCQAPSPTWASINLGVFICLECSAHHRAMGTHLSKVKSTTLDKWTTTMVEGMRTKGNLKANAYWEKGLLPGYQRPKTSEQRNTFIRAKYEQGKFKNAPELPIAPSSSVEKQPPAVVVEQQQTKDERIRRRRAPPGNNAPTSFSPPTTTTTTNTPSSPEVEDLLSFGDDQVSTTTTTSALQFISTPTTTTSSSLPFISSSTTSALPFISAQSSSTSTALPFIDTNSSSTSSSLPFIQQQQNIPSQLPVSNGHQTPPSALSFISNTMTTSSLPFISNTNSNSSLPFINAPTGPSSSFSFLSNNSTNQAFSSPLQQHSNNNTTQFASISSALSGLNLEIDKISMRLETSMKILSQLEEETHRLDSNLSVSLGSIPFLRIDKASFERNSQPNQLQAAMVKLRQAADEIEMFLKQGGNKKTTIAKLKDELATDCSSLDMLQMKKVDSILLGTNPPSELVEARKKITTRISSLSENAHQLHGKASNLC